MSLGTKTAQTPAEFQNLVAIYESNGFKIKKQSDTEYTLLKKTCKKKRKTFKGAPWWLVIKLTALCCTIFTAPLHLQRPSHQERKRHHRLGEVTSYSESELGPSGPF